MSQFESGGAVLVVGLAVLPGAAVLLAAGAVAGGAVAIGSFFQRCYERANVADATTPVPRSVDLAAYRLDPTDTIIDLRTKAPHLASAIDTYADSIDDVTTAAAAAVAALRRDEQLVAVAAFQLALSDMHFATNIRRPDEAAGAREVEGVGESAHVRVRVQDDGSVDIDVASCEGNACVPMIADLQRRVAMYGLHIDAQRVKKTRVGRQGGPLFGHSLPRPPRPRRRGIERGRGQVR